MATVTGTTTRTRLTRAQVLNASIPFLAVVTALALGAILIAATSGIEAVGIAYRGLFEGAFGSRRAISETLIATTPFILAGLAVALGFRCGLFNIGAEGQFYVGSISAVIVGYTVTGLPIYIHLPLALAAGILGGAVWGAIPGYLRARLGAHEVINTIMLNYIGVRSVDWLVRGPLRDPHTTLDRTPYVLDSARLPPIFADLRLHLGFLIALLAVVGVYWLLFKTTLGYEIRTVGANPSAARYAGISVSRNIVLAMALSGGLAGLAGAVQQLGVNYTVKAVFATGYGFDSIAIALLAKSNPIAVVPAALLWGSLRNGAALMQLRSGISIDMISIIQALVIMFVAADQIIRWIYRIRAERGAEVVFTRGWGQ